MSTISRTVLREQVKEILLERILQGELESGERLVETRLARELQLVESEPFPGARVRAVDDSQLLPVFPVRAALEELAAREAARNADGDVAVLDRELEATRDARARSKARKHVRRTERVVRRRTRSA